MCRNRMISSFRKLHLGFLQHSLAKIPAQIFGGAKVCFPTSKQRRKHISIIG